MLFGKVGLPPMKVADKIGVAELRERVATSLGKVLLAGQLTLVEPKFVPVPFNPAKMLSVITSASPSKSPAFNETERSPLEKFTRKAVGPTLMKGLKVLWPKLGGPPMEERLTMSKTPLGPGLEKVAVNPS
jgi:hypothetical protein